MKAGEELESSEEEKFAVPASQAEDALISEMCSSISVDEISFEQWCRHHNTLDLEYTVVINRKQLQQVYRTQVKLTRTIRRKTPDGTKEQREKISHDIVLMPDATPPRALIIKGKGDCKDDISGDLVIIFCIKD